MATAVAVLIPVTPTGTLESAFVPSPNWPLPFRPQHCTAPLASSAQLCPSAVKNSPPAATAVAELIPVTATGTLELVVVPLPNWPKKFTPQQFTAPLASNAQPYKSRYATAV